MKMSTIKINDLNIYYEQEGEGEDIVLLHGWGQNVEAMRPVFDNLKHRFRVTMFDFPGFGESDEPDHGYDVYEYAEDFKKFLVELKIEKPKLIGHSFGGRVSIIHASKYDVDKMVLTGSAGIKPIRSIGYYIRVYTYKTVKHILKLPFLKKYEEQVKSKFGSSDYKSASVVMRESLVKVVNEDLQYLFPHIKASTLLVWGDKDDATPLKDGKKMEKAIEDAGLVVFEGYGHYAYLQNVNQFNRVVNYFFTEGA